MANQSENWGHLLSLLRTATATINDVNGLPTQPEDGARVQDLLLLLKASRGGFLFHLVWLWRREPWMRSSTGWRGWAGAVLCMIHPLLCMCIIPEVPNNTRRGTTYFEQYARLLCFLSIWTGFDRDPRGFIANSSAVQWSSVEAVTLSMEHCSFVRVEFNIPGWLF